MSVKKALQIQKLLTLHPAPAWVATRAGTLQGDGGQLIRQAEEPAKPLQGDG